MFDVAVFRRAALVLLHDLCHFFVVWARCYCSLLGCTRSRGRCWAAIRLSHRPEPSGHAVHGEVDRLDIRRQDGRRFVLLRHTQGRRGGHTPFVQAGAETSNTGSEGDEGDPRCSWKESLYHKNAWINHYHYLMPEELMAVTLNSHHSSFVSAVHSRSSRNKDLLST